MLRVLDSNKDMADRGVERISFNTATPDIRSIYGTTNDVPSNIVIRSPEVYSNLMVAEKIVNCSVTEEGIRYYKIQWQDSWLLEHTVMQFPNHQNLIENYWLAEGERSIQQKHMLEQKTLRKAKTSIKRKNIAPQASLHNENIIPTLETVTQLKNASVNEVSGHSLAAAVNTLANNLSLGAHNSSLLHTVQEDASSTISSLAINTELNIGGSNDAETQNILQNSVLKAQLSAILGESVSAISQNNHTTQINNEAINSDDFAVEVDIPLPIPQVESKVNALSKFSTCPNPKKHKQVISMDSFDLVNIENFEVAEDELKAAAIEVLNSFKRKRVRFPNGSSKLPQKCFFCLRMISNRKKLREHQFGTHFRNIGEHACPICGQRFVFNRQMRDHLVTHTDQRRFVCKVCGLTCKRRSHLHKHMDTHKKEMNYRCDVCHENFKVQADLKAHCFSTHKNKSMQCGVCKNTLNTPNSVYLHSLRHSGTRDYSCEICKRSFKRKQHLIAHSAVHGKAKETFQCPGCDKTFTDRKIFRKHLDVVHKEIASNYKYDYTCSVCEKNFAYKGRLDEHMKTHENETEHERVVRESKKRVDSLTDEQLANEYHNFEKVVDSENNEIRVKCKICKDREFRLMSAVNRHIDDHELGRVRNGKRPGTYRCQICNKGFNSKGKMEFHMENECQESNGNTLKRNRIHGKTVHMQCRKCNKSFKWKSCLQAHIAKCSGQIHISRTVTKRSVSSRTSAPTNSASEYNTSSEEDVPIIFIVNNADESTVVDADGPQNENETSIRNADDANASVCLGSPVQISLNDNIMISVEKSKIPDEIVVDHIGSLDIVQPDQSQSNLETSGDIHEVIFEPLSSNNGTNQGDLVPIFPLD